VRVRSIAAALAFGAAAACVGAFAQAPEPPAAEEQPQPRFIWGLLMQVAASKVGGYAWDLFVRWLDAKAGPGGIAGLSQSFVPSLMKPSPASIGPRSSALGASGAVVVATPEAPVQVADGRPNYEGAHMAILVADPSGTTYSVRSIAEGFRTGERFKVRVLSTFESELTLENITPRGERRQIYPRLAHEAVQLPAGQEIFVPLGAQEYFELTGSTGTERLLLNVADRRAVGPLVSQARVYRQDTTYGSNFLQPVVPGKYPAISQGVELSHR
jgi:hypothetical protein